MTVIFSNDWADILNGELEQPYYRELRARLAELYRTDIVYPSMYDIYNALHYTSFANTRVVIIGQDPYHGPGQAHGLSFSVQPGVKAPPSLRNIFQELQEDLGCPVPDHGNLVPWAKRGVLMLNNVLTVRAGVPASHQGIGWERFTDAVIAALNGRERPAVFILWGKHAIEKASSIDRSRHCVLSSPHPSPFAAYRGFFGSRPFSKANEFLRRKGEGEIDWCLPMLADLKDDEHRGKK